MERRNLITLVCAFCGSPFEGRPPCKGRNRRFCSKSCSTRSHYPDLAGRFWEKVAKGPDCWLWTGAINSSGYGSFAVGDRRGMNAARVSWELANGPIPEGMHVLHACDVRSCVRPDHLFLGTNAENMADRDAKGRCQQGERHVSARLTEDDVRYIRMGRIEGLTNAQMARYYGVSTTTIQHIIDGSYWKSVK